MTAVAVFGSKDFINVQLSKQVDDWEQIDIELIKIFKQLNEDGKAVAIERVEELTEIPRYTQKEKNLPDKGEWGYKNFLHPAARYAILEIQRESHRSGSTLRKNKLRHFTMSSRQLLRIVGGYFLPLKIV